MRAVLTNLGSTGDVQPIIALAVELRRHGHSPILALSPHYKAHVQRYGLEFAAIGPDLNYAELQRNHIAALMHGVSELGLMSDSLDILRSILPRVFSELRDVCRDADVLISGHLQMASRMIHELTRIPYVSVQVNHFGGMQQAIARQAIASVINEFRAQYGLSPLSDPVHTDANSSQLALYAISRYFRPPSIGWPAHYHVTGFFFLDDEVWEPDPDIASFIQSGPPPVVISFGSMAHENSDAMTELLLKATRIAGCRAIVQSGWSGLGNRKTPSDARFIDFVPYTWLFKHASCVVHHGGIGTVATAIRAGKPAVIAPHMADQPLVAELTRSLGCAGFVIPLRDLTAERLGTAIATTLATPQYYRNVALVRKKMSAERGVVEARYLIERLVNEVGARRRTAVPDEQDAVCLDLQRVSRRKEYQLLRRLRKREHPSIPGKNVEE
jgi:sterol 3beta-glucosyltransferase